MKIARTFQALLVALALCTLAAAPAQADIELADIACESTATTGTGTLDLDGAAVGGYLSLAAAGVSSGATVPYQISTGSGASRKIETGWGTFTDASPDTLDRTVVHMSTDGAGTALDLSGTSTVCVGPIAKLYRGVHRVGEFFWFTSSSCPSYALRANGAAVSQTTYADLHGEFGADAFGADSGGNFTMPNLTGARRFIRAADGSNIVVGGMQLDAAPQISGSVNSAGRGIVNGASGAFVLGGGTIGAIAPGTAGVYRTGFVFYASSSSPSYGRDGSAEVRPAYIALTPCIVF